MNSSKNAKLTAVSLTAASLIATAVPPEAEAGAAQCRALFSATATRVQAEAATRKKTAKKREDTEFQELLRPRYAIDKENARVELDWAHIEKELSSRLPGEAFMVSLLIDGVAVKDIPRGKTSEILQFPVKGQQHDIVVQFKNRDGKIVHETYPVLMESVRSQIVEASSFKRFATEAPLELWLPRSFVAKTGINDGLVRRTVELGYQKIVWTATEQAGPATRKIVQDHGINLKVFARLNAQGEPVSYVLADAEGRTLGLAKPHEIRIQNDAAFNGNAFFWDNEFVSLASALHHPYLGRSTMDFHYATQEKLGIGVIPREVRHSNLVSYHRYEDVKFGEKRVNDEYTNPNFSGWVERYTYALSDPAQGKGRLKTALRSMEKYAEWLDKTRSVRDENGKFVGYYTSNLASGADNSPRAGTNNNKANFHKVGWVDLLAQQILMFKDMAKIHATLGEWTQAERKLGRARELEQILNTRYWNEEHGFYFDLVPDANGRLVQDVKTATQGSFWALVAGSASNAQLRDLIEKQMTPERFGGRFPGASLASEHPEFHHEGGYWRGGRWPPTGVIMTQGFENSGRHDQAFAVARDFWAAMSEVSRDHKAKHGEDTVFEFYGVDNRDPRAAKPIAGVQEGHATRKDFTGWGKTPITYSGIRNVAGLRPVPAFAGQAADLPLWLGFIARSSDSHIGRYPELLSEPVQRKRIAAGFLEWNLHFDFAAGESISLKNFVYQGQTIRRMEIVKQGFDSYKIIVDSDQPIRLQVNRLFQASQPDAVADRPLAGTDVIEAGGAKARQVTVQLRAI